MERNQIIGFILIFLIIMAWSVLNKPDPEAISTAEETAIETEAPTSSTETGVVNITDNNPIVNNSESLTDSLLDTRGIFGRSSIGEESIESLENDKIKVSFSNKGAQIKSVEIKEHLKITKSEDGEEIKRTVQLLEDAKNSTNYRMNIGNSIVDTKNLYASPSISGNTITYTFNGAGGRKITKKYTLNDDSYIINQELSTTGINDIISTDLEITNYLDRIEENYTFEKTVSTVYFKETDESSDYCGCRGDDVEDLSGKKIDWFSFSNQFFNTAYIAKESKLDGIVASVEMSDETSEDLKKTTVVASIPLVGSQSRYEMDIYVGPNEYAELKAAAPDLEEIIPYGRSIFGSINRHFIRPFFNFLAGFIGSKGIVIILIIFIIKMAVYPLTYKMLHSQAKMGALKPEIAKMKDRLKDDSQKQQMETMKLYREYGVNPMGGCLPMFIQMPIWYALFRFFPASITFRQESFLWAHDLSSFDDILQLPFTIPGMGSHLSLFTILWAIATVIYTFYNTKHMDMTANPAMKYVQYLMPLMFFVFFNNYASGLTCYMFFSQLITIAQTIITKKYVFDDEKILAQLNKKKSAPKKKTGFQARLADAMEQQRKIQEQKQKQQQAKKKKR